MEQLQQITWIMELFIPPLHHYSLFTPPILYPLCPLLYPNPFFSLSPPLLLLPPLLIHPAADFLAHEGTFQMPAGNAKCSKLLLARTLNASLFLTIGSRASFPPALRRPRDKGTRIKRRE